MCEKCNVLNFNKDKDILVIEVDFDATTENMSAIKERISNQTDRKIPPESILILDKFMKMKGMIVNE